MIKGCLRIVSGDTVLSGILLLKNTVAAAESSIISSAKIKNGATKKIRQGFLKKMYWTNFPSYSFS